MEKAATERGKGVQRGLGGFENWRITQKKMFFDGTNSRIYWN
jgi:hypothetical protein